MSLLIIELEAKPDFEEAIAKLRKEKKAIKRRISYVEKQRSMRNCLDMMSGNGSDDEFLSNEYGPLYERCQKMKPTERSIFLAQWSNETLNSEIAHLSSQLPILRRLLNLEITKNESWDDIFQSKVAILRKEALITKTKCLLLVIIMKRLELL